MNNKQNKTIKDSTVLVIPILLSLGLTACNSSSSSNSSSHGQNILSGQITGLSIEGLSYQTESQAGTTAADSTFRYKEGESVSFFLGDISLGQTVATPEVTLFDLVGITDIDAVTEAIETKLTFASNNSSTASGTRYDYERLGNLVSFLSAIDDDGEFSNGITIPANLETIAQGKTVGILSTRSNVFKVHLNTSGLFSEAVSAGIWESEPSVLSTGLALDAFYDSIGVTPKINVTSHKYLDTDSDGTVDFTVGYIYDANGNLSSETITPITNDSPGQITSYTYDSLGQTTGFYFDHDHDGTLDYQQEWAFNEKGEQVLRQVDNDGNGIFESRQTNEIEYYDNGAVSSSKEVNEQFSDTTGELAAFSSTTYRFDTNGETLYEASSTQQSIDSEVFSVSTTYTRNANGQITKKEESSSNDGTPDVIYTYQYDDEGNEILAEVDTDADGQIDSSVSTNYERVGDQLTVTRGSATYIGTYDAYDNLSSQLIDEDGDGVYEQQITWDRSYDADGRLLSYYHTDSTSPEKENTISISYDSEGRVLTEQSIYPLNPAINSSRSFTYDGEGNAASTSFEYGVLGTTEYHKYTTDVYGGQTSTYYDSDGNIESTDSQLYDELGNLIEISSRDSYGTYSKTWTYNTKGQLLHQSTKNDDEVITSTEYTYNAQGELSSKYTESVDRDEYRTTTYDYVATSSWRALFKRFGLE